MSKLRHQRLSLLQLGLFRRNNLLHGFPLDIERGKWFLDVFQILSEGLWPTEAAKRDHGLRFRDKCTVEPIELLFARQRERQRHCIHLVSQLQGLRLLLLAELLFGHFGFFLSDSSGLELRVLEWRSLLAGEEKISQLGELVVDAREDFVELFAAKRGPAIELHSV